MGVRMDDDFEDGTGEYFSYISKPGFVAAQYFL
jgi:hypothetical protein